ncbi:increased loss of mitochondrial DNA protein 1 [Sordaria brevicollis]|uniref:Increased loss of mitochondrial DNA protein 1 n=1 Tax=Sordaria brevicollis TaxID=83679 RepID=A0AAE0PIE0_SORBR|nr:increased loss of mitochondrial DNA protein 1 [Sordaria brevicollis]
MGLLSAKTLLTSIALFHITLAFFFITNPAKIADQGVVWLLGEAMGLPKSLHFTTQSPTTAFLGIILLLLGLSDLTSLSMPEEISLLHHWSSQIPLRLTFSFLLTLYSFFFSTSSPLYNEDVKFSHPTGSFGEFAARDVSGDWGWGGDALKNRVFFTFMFVETFSWFWALMTINEEREGLVRRARERREREAERMRL